MERIAITQEGHENLQKELQRLKSHARPAVIEAIASARALGDLSENAEYHAAKEKQGFVESRILELEDKISRSNVVNVSKLSGDKVMFGATVSIIDAETQQHLEYQIVGADESDVSRKKLSINAPMAKTLIGKRIGDNVEVQTPRGLKYYEITKVSFV